MGTRRNPGVRIGFFLLLPWLAHAQEIENDPADTLPVQAEATTAVVPGNAEDAQQRPSRAYTDGQLADPEPKAADLGMAEPSSPITLPTDDAQGSK